MQKSALPLLALSTLLALGCGDAGPTTIVRGTISYKGNPVPGGLINFQPATGHPMGGEFAADGSYSYELPPGQYKVRVDSPPKMPPGHKEGDPIPKLGPPGADPKYANYGSSGLTLTVPEQSEPLVHDFVLE